MAKIVAFPASRDHSSDVSPCNTRRSSWRLTYFALAVAAPALAVGLTWGMIDAVTYTQSSLMGLYSTGSTAA